MITGDNAQCGYYIARSCAMLSEGVGILLGEMDRTEKRVTWKRMGQEFENDKPISTDQVYDHPAVRSGELELAVTGNDAYTELYVGRGILRTQFTSLLCFWAYHLRMLIRCCL